MKVFLDDFREAPDGWVRTRTSQETIELLKTGQVEILSLDHDLGGDDTIGTGNTVLVWLEDQVATKGFRPPSEIFIHSANPAGR